MQRFERMPLALWSIPLLAAAIVAVTAQAPSRPSSYLKHAKRLDDIVERVDLIDGVETIGGASIEDAVLVLRERTDFPVALETLEFERPKDFVTLGEALAKLHSIQTIGPLSARDKIRLDEYEKKSRTGDQTEILFVRQKLFTLIQDNTSVRALLDRLVALDDEYVWKNYGTEGAPLILVEPRAASVLDWPLSSICHPRPITTTDLYEGCNSRPGGPFTKLLNDHNITVTYMFEGLVSPGKLTTDPLRHAALDMCSDHLTARDVLNLTVKGTHISWTLAGIKGQRFLSFEPSTH